jgi:hypothetical protein
MSLADFVVADACVRPLSPGPRCKVHPPVGPAESPGPADFGLTLSQNLWANLIRPMEFAGACPLGRPGPSLSGYGSERTPDIIVAMIEPSAGSALRAYTLSARQFASRPGVKRSSAEQQSANLMG